MRGVRYKLVTKSPIGPPQRLKSKGKKSQSRAGTSDRNQTGLVFQTRPKPDQKPDQTRPDWSSEFVPVFETKIYACFWVSKIQNQTSSAHC